MYIKGEKRYYVRNRVVPVLCCSELNEVRWVLLRRNCHLGSTAVSCVGRTACGGRDRSWFRKVTSTHPSGESGAPPRKVESACRKSGLIGRRGMYKTNLT